MKMIRKLALKYGIGGEIRESTRKDKKLMILYEDRWIHFGNPAYEDYTVHRDGARRERYRLRSSRIKKKDGSLAGSDPGSANFYAMRLLWDVTP